MSNAKAFAPQKELIAQLSDLKIIQRQSAMLLSQKKDCADLLFGALVFLRVLSLKSLSRELKDLDQFISKFAQAFFIWLGVHSLLKEHDKTALKVALLETFKSSFERSLASSFSEHLGKFSTSHPLHFKKSLTDMINRALFLKLELFVKEYGFSNDVHTSMTLQIPPENATDILPLNVLDMSFSSEALLSSIAGKRSQRLFSNRRLASKIGRTNLGLDSRALFSHDPQMSRENCSARRIHIISCLQNVNCKVSIAGTSRKFIKVKKETLRKVASSLKRLKPSDITDPIIKWKQIVRDLIL